MKPMRIALPVAQFHVGNTAEYAARALASLGHTAEIVDETAFLRALRGSEFDIYFCIDSGKALDLRAAAGISRDLRRVAFWCIDFRHNKARPERVPNDLDNIRILTGHGGSVFQAQQEDALECAALGIPNVEWLPLAADPDIWSDAPRPVEPRFDLGFVGNVWDKGRLEVLQSLQKLGVRFGFGGGGRLFKEQAAAFLRHCRAGFNVSSFFGTSFAFDVNMRVYETLSCGIPLITNRVQGLQLFGDAPFIRTYDSAEDCAAQVVAALNDESFMKSGKAARDWIMQNATYRHRAQSALTVLEQRI